MRVRRVGSITCGILLIFFGILFMVHMFYPPLSLVVIMKLWPIILVSLGGEMIVSILLVLLLACFAVGMGVLEYFMEYYQQYGAVYY